ncbi:MAG: dephospho-CoA kinase [Candidatus Electrothrix sp. MAN1_4]|nr:dephospho-CoA kinase [Candidatus Electrothrix sp. MAN1_4]
MHIEQEETTTGSSSQHNRVNAQPIIAITGGIGSGKSRVSSFLAQEYNLPLINIDHVCRELLQPGKAGWLALRSLLPKTYFNTSGELNRQHFRQQLFTDSALRDRVDATLHPLARQEMKNRIARFQGPILVEIPLLFEAGWQDDVDVILVVYADEDIRIQRIMERDNVTEEQAQHAVAAQQCLREKAASADYVIDNSGSWEQTCLQLHQLAETCSLV